MKQTIRGLILAAGLTGSAAAGLAQSAATAGAPVAAKLPDLPQDEVLLRAARDEMARMSQLAIVGGKDAPYFVSYTISDADSLRVSSMLGATVNVARNQFRAPSAEVRVGSYDYDNTGHAAGGGFGGTNFSDGWPLDANYQGLRNSFWLATDYLFKASLDSIARKRASQNNAASDPNPLPNFSRVEPVVSIPKISFEKIDEPGVTARANRLSAIFKKYPEVLTSQTEIQAMTGTTTQITSEGTMIRYEDGIGWILGKAEAQAPDGMIVHDAATLQSLTIRTMPSEADAQKAFTEVAENVRALAKAPTAEAYTGPVLFEPRAAAQLLTQLLGDNLRINRRPLTAPGQAANVQTSEFESRLNVRVMPEFFDVTDDSTQKTYNGKPLVGFYEYDLEGVKPKPVSIVEKGVLKSVLTTRTPVRNFLTSNGHARLPGNYGAHTAAIGNLFVKANESKPLADLKAQMIQMVTQSNKPYGMIVRKLDYPYSGAASELQAVVQANAQGGGAARPLSPPLMVYRVYPDGREELVRGLRFHGVSARSLRDIVAASQETAVFEYVNTATLMALLGSGGYLAPTSVVAPGLLFDEIEMEVPREQLPKAPAVPPPPIQP